MRDGGKGVKSAYRGLRSRLRESQIPQQLQNGLESPSDKPRSAPNSPTGKRRSLGALATYRKDPMTFKNAVSERSVLSSVMSRMEWKLYTTTIKNNGEAGSDSSLVRKVQG